MTNTCVVSGPTEGGSFHWFKGRSFPEPFATPSSLPQKAPRLWVLLAQKTAGTLQPERFFA